MSRISAISPAKWISRHAVRRGLFGSSRIWLGVFVTTRVVRLARRLLRPEAEAHVERLEPGDGLEIRNLEHGTG